MKRLWLSCLGLSALLWGGGSSLAQEGADTKKPVVIPEGLGIPAEGPGLPATLPERSTEPKRMEGEAATLSRGAPPSPSISLDTGPTNLAPSQRLPSMGPSGTPKKAAPPPEDDEAAPASAATLVPAEGVVLGKSGSLITLMGPVGAPIRYILPDYAYLVNISGGSLQTPDALKVGDFVALIGHEQGTGRILFAHLPMGTQPLSAFDALSETIERSYKRAVDHLEAAGPEGEEGGAQGGDEGEDEGMEIDGDVTKEGDR